MTQEDKELLLKDLSTRLPYGVKIRIIHHEIKGTDPEYVDDVFSTTHYNMIDYDDDNYEFLPYLRPMSSMTPKERKEYKHLVAFSGNPIGSAIFIDWLNAHHFDYRGLISKGLAIEAPDGMYEKEEQQ